MDTIQVYSYLNGMCVALYLVACLLGGLQLCFGVLFHKQDGSILVSRYVGVIFLLMSSSGVCYILSALYIWSDILLIVGSSIDLVMFAMIVCVGYMLWTNKFPSGYVLPVLTLPLAVLLVLNVFWPAIRNHIPDISSAVMMSYFVFFELKLRKHDRLLEDLYSDPESHSSKWRWSLPVFLAGWFTIRHIFLSDELNAWCDVALYVFMSSIILFVFVKIINFGEPVSLETVNQVEADTDFGIVDASQEAEMPLQEEFLQLLVEKKLFLKSDLTVEEIVKDLGTNTKYFSKMLRDEMHTSFCGVVNSYRVERAKELLKSKDYLIEKIALSSGFNSRQSFTRTFTSITGKTPSEWRKLYLSPGNRDYE